MEQLTKNQAVATSQEAVQNQNEPQLRDENAHNDKSVHGVLNPTYQAGLRRDAVQPDIEAERKKRDEIEAGKSYCSRRFGGATCDEDRKSGSAGMPRPISYGVFCWKKKNNVWIVGKRRMRVMIEDFDPLDLRQQAAIQRGRSGVDERTPLCR